jgi:hypothetical protein
VADSAANKKHFIGNSFGWILPIRWIMPRQRYVSGLCSGPPHRTAGLKLSLCTPVATAGRETGSAKCDGGAPSNEERSALIIFRAIYFSYPEYMLYIFVRTGAHPRLTRRWQRHSAPGLNEGKNFFIWIRRNPLKSPDSAKGIQGNPSLFPWISLVLLAFTVGKYRSSYVLLDA